jgi:DNA sulfur modification protein DndE
MYDEGYFFVPNEINRYTLSSRFDLKYNKDGSLDFYIQKDNPGKDKEANWLPSPVGGFILMFRFYWPEQAILDGTWKLPEIKKIK